MVCLLTEAGRRLLESGDAFVRRPGRRVACQQRDPRVPEAMQILRRGANAATMVERHRIELLWVLAVEQDDRNLEAPDLLGQL